MPELYRKAALERISNPEQLDRALKITSPLSWLVLVAITIMIAITGVWSVYGNLPTTVSAPCQIVSPASTNAVYATVTGTVNQIYVYEGEQIVKGQEVMQIGLADGTVRTIASDQDGIVSEISVMLAATVTQNSEIIRITPNTAADRVAVAYVPFSDVKKIRSDLGWRRDGETRETAKRGPQWLREMVESLFPQAADDGSNDVQITLSNLNSQTYGHMTGYVMNIDSQPTSTTSMGKVLGKENNQATTFAKDNIPVAAVTIGLYTTEDGRIWWSNEKGMGQEVGLGAQGTARFIVRKDAPITKLFTRLKEIWSGGD